MVNPTLTKKKENSLSLNQNTKKLFQTIYREQHKEESGDEVPKIKVSELVSKMAFYYEKIRNSVDYKEEHLLRKNAIERILRRQIIIQGAIKEPRSDEIAKHLLIELIRAAYLPNNKVPEDKIVEVSQIINRYIKLKNYCLARFSGQENNKDEKNELVKWIIAMAACDLEEKLGRNPVNQTVVSNMYEVLIANIKLPENSAYHPDLDIQVYLSIHRNFLKFDRELSEFILFKHFNPSWGNATNEQIARLAQNIIKLRQETERQISHPLIPQLDRIVKSFTVFFTVLTDVIEDDPAGVYENFKTDPKAFPRQIKKMCNLRYRQSRVKLRRAALRSIIYIFITKMILVILLEVPVTLWLEQPLSYNSLAINVGFPPFLLFLIVMMTRVPSQHNSNKIVEGVEEVVFEGKGREGVYKLRPPIKRSQAMNIIFGVIYGVTFFLSFGAVVWALNQLDFNIVSIIIFLFFLTVVSFFGIRIRKGAHEYVVVEPKDNIFSFFVDFFYIPIIEVGKLISEKFSRINVFVFILDFIIEAPFKIFVEIAEDWTKYVKERKEEIV